MRKIILITAPTIREMGPEIPGMPPNPVNQEILTTDLVQGTREKVQGILTTLLDTRPTVREIPATAPGTQGTDLGIPGMLLGMILMAPAILVIPLGKSQAAPEILIAGLGMDTRGTALAMAMGTALAMGMGMALAMDAHSI